jgi:hypothetical protein
MKLFIQFNFNKQDYKKKIKKVLVFAIFSMTFFDYMACYFIIYGKNNFSATIAIKVFVIKRVLYFLF